MKTQIQKVWENYKKPTPVKFRKIGDFSLLLIPVIQIGLAEAPEGVLEPSTKFWIGFVASIVLTIVKFLTNTMPEKNLSE